jgi:hypothetical protein
MFETRIKFFYDQLKDGLLILSSLLKENYTRSQIQFYMDNFSVFFFRTRMILIYALNNLTEQIKMMGATNCPPTSIPELRPPN